MTRRLSITLALSLAATGCGRTTASPDDATGVARQADGPGPSVGFAIDLAPPKAVPLPISRLSVASRGHDFFAAFGEGGLPDSNGALRGIRFDAAGKPTSDPIVLVKMPVETTQGTLGAAACEPDGDCILLGTGQPIGGTGSEIFVATLGKNGKVERRILSLASEVVPFPQVAFDPDASAFLVVWNDTDLFGRHFAGGAPVESAPIDLAPDAVPRGVACLAHHGCLVTMAPSGGSGTSAVHVEGSSAAAPVPISDAPLDLLAAGFGVYAATQPIGESFGLTRLDPNGALLDPAPVPVFDLAQSSQSVAGLDFDGTNFVALVNGYDDPDGQLINAAAIQAGRLSSDGTRLAPVAIPAASGRAEGVACGAGTCEVATSFDRSGFPTGATVAIEHGTATPSAFDLLRSPGSQIVAAALAIGSKVLIAWNEEPIARARWFSGAGTPLSDPIDIGGPLSVVAGVANGDRGLLMFAHDGGAREVRIVSADGKIGEGVPLVFPTHASREHAAFGYVDDFLVSSLGPGAVVLRFDADGHALDGGTVVNEQTQAFGPRLAQVGDTFLIVSAANGADELVFTRMRDTGDIVGSSTAKLPARADHQDLVCSASECAIALVARPANSTNSASSENEIWFATMPLDGNDFALAPGHFRADDARVAFDGRHFIGMLAQNGNLEATRLDEEPHFGSSPLDGDVISAVASVGDGRLVVAENEPLSFFLPSRADVRTISDLPASAGSGGGITTSDNDTEALVAGGGCGCRIDERADAGSWIALAALGLVFARRRR